MTDLSFVTNQHPAYLENLYNDYLKNPTATDPEWAKFFQGFDFAVGKNGNGQATASPSGSGGKTGDGAAVKKELAVYTLIRSFRKRGHLEAKTNPIRPRKDRHAHLTLEDVGLAESDLNTVFAAGSIMGMEGKPLRDILARLQKVYAGDVGIEYTYINDPERCRWVEQHFEQMMDQELDADTKKRILGKLNEGVIFEKFLHTKYIGQKRFSLEGGESTIPFLDTLINHGADAGVKEVVIGMAHRGRLNVLANTLGKTYEQIFAEFDGAMPEDSTMGSGDVKYHLGFRANHKSPAGNEINVQLAPNPSHLEVVDPVVTGFARAKADVLYGNEYDRVLPILIHGDAAIAGQGVVYELLQMSRLKGYFTGGTIHFVINNQIGFTTDFDDARSADYSTSVAAMLQCPVIHVNGDDPEAVVKSAMLAIAYRQEWNQDIFVDMVCYRRHGHNEGDDPSFTQPLMYELIKAHANPREVYNEKLIARGDVDAALAKEMEESFWKTLQDRLDEVKQSPKPYTLQGPEQAWQDMKRPPIGQLGDSPKTGIAAALVDQLFTGLMQTPEGFTPLRKIKKLMDEKAAAYQKDGLIDWATAELMAYASILHEGNTVRMSGQDVQRGTFSHRHAVLHDEKTNDEYSRVNGAVESLVRADTNQGDDPTTVGTRLPAARSGDAITKGSPATEEPASMEALGEKAQALANNGFQIYNSLLSEFAVLGFEFGYAIANPGCLTIWEAQFGDFANGCQTVIDQYLASAETKWQKMCGLVLLLPHGYEGQGPEHSSARMERFLQLCAEDNLIITNITTAANFFHGLRRQLVWNFRRPMVNFSPKANLRLQAAYSPKDAFTQGRFQEVIDDAQAKTGKGIKKVLLCSGKVYYELRDQQQELGKKDVAIVRLEQIYPLPVRQLEALRDKYKSAEWVWVQEEPLNAGAASFLRMNLEVFPFRIVSRPAGAAAATGFSKMHKMQLEELMKQALA